MESAAVAAAPDPTLDPPLEQLRHLAGELRQLLPGVRVGEAQETTKEFDREAFWGRLTFSRLPLPSPQVGFTFLEFLCCFSIP
uniref:Uncharacterized protein n=1 Tax=Moschus moschiferus TaxID=68415 RepID=A0A8C6DW81_MOSMO